MDRYLDILHSAQADYEREEPTYEELCEILDDFDDDEFPF